MKTKKTKHIEIKLTFIEDEHYENMLEAILEMSILLEFEKGILWAIDTLLSHWLGDNQNVVTWREK